MTDAMIRLRGTLTDAVHGLGAAPRRRRIVGVVPPPAAMENWTKRSNFVHSLCGNGRNGAQPRINPSPTPGVGHWTKRAGGHKKGPTRKSLGDSPNSL